MERAAAPGVLWPDSALADSTVETTAAQISRPQYRAGPLPRLSCANRRLLDRAPDKTLNENGDEGPDPRGAELAVDDSDPALQVGVGDLFSRVAPAKSLNDLDDLLVVCGLARRRVRVRIGVRCWR